MSGLGVLAAGIAATGSLVAQGVKNYQDKKRYEQQLKDERANWNMQNQYNSPSAQMARLKSAGLNPNLVYQQGAALSGAGDMATPSYPEAPLMDYQNIAQMALQADQVSANIRKSNAEADALESSNRDRFTPLSKLYNFEEQERKYWAQSLGLTTSDVDNLNLNRMAMMMELKKQSKDSKNLDEVYKILSNNVGTAENEAYSAAFSKLLLEMEVDTEARKRGYNLGFKPDYFGENYLFKHPSSALEVLKDSKKADYVAEMFLREYKEMRWQSSDAKHILDQVHQSLDHVPALRKGKPTIRGIERSGGKYNYTETYKY